MPNSSATWSTLRPARATVEDLAITAKEIGCERPSCTAGLQIELRCWQAIHAAKLWDRHETREESVVLADQVGMGKTFFTTGSTSLISTQGRSRVEEGVALTRGTPPSPQASKARADRGPVGLIGQ
jgi:hypothetical protein